MFGPIGYVLGYIVFPVLRLVGWILSPYFWVRDKFFRGVEQ